MSSMGQVFGAPQVSGSTPLATGHVWFGASGVAADTTPLGTGTPVLSTETTWTPAISTLTTPGTPAYSVQVGSYERIGRLVCVRFNIQLSGWTGSPTGSVTVTGLPVASTSTTNDVGVGWVGFYTAAGLAASNFGLSLYIDPNTSLIRVMQSSGTASSSLTAAQAGAAFAIFGGAIYRT